MEDERREYFRIEDIAWVLSHDFDPAMPSVVEYFPQLRHITAEHELHHIDDALRQLQSKLEDKPVSRYVQLLNQKIDVFHRNLLIQQLDRLPESPQTVTLSEGGISFRRSEPVDIGQLLAIAIVFSPSYDALYLKGEVVDLDTDGSSEGTMVHTAFRDMPETERQHLARHVLAQQTRSRSRGDH